MQHNLLIINTDGGARGNPGRAAIGVVICDENKNILFEFGELVGETTNNVAEYLGVIKALNFLISHKIRIQKIEFYLDSLLVVQQLKGAYKIKNQNLIELAQKVKNLTNEVGASIEYFSIPRERNSRADRWVNHALNNYIK
jgi:ribonuclease HI